MEETKPDFPEAARDATLRLARHLPEQRDLTLIVLKGHLLVEQQLYDIIRSRAAYPSALENANPRFWQLSRFTRALVGKDSPDDLWTAIDGLNKLRNELAHRLEPQAIERFATTFLEAMPLPFETPPAFDSTIEDKVKNMIAFVCGALMRLVVVKANVSG